MVYGLWDGAILWHMAYYGIWHIILWHMAYGKGDKTASQKTRLAIGIYNVYILQHGVEITIDGTYSGEVHDAC